MVLSNFFLFRFSSLFQHLKLACKFVFFLKNIKQERGVKLLSTFRFHSVICSFLLVFQVVFFLLRQFEIENFTNFQRLALCCVCDIVSLALCIISLFQSAISFMYVVTIESIQIQCLLPKYKSFT